MSNINYNNECQSEIYCEICLSNVSLSDSFELTNCKHKFCKADLKEQ